MIRFQTPDGPCLIPAAHVLGVASAVAVRPFPARRDGVMGFVEWGGRALTVSSALGGAGRHVLLVAVSGGSFGLVADEVLGLVAVDDAAVQPAPAGRARPLVEAMVSAAGGLEMMISAEELWRMLEGTPMPEAVALPGRALKLLSDELPLRLLLAEDNVVVRLLHKRLLGKLGYAVDLASNGKEVIEAMGRADYDLVFMDVEMPEMDGLAAMREIVQRWPSGRPPVIAMTATDLEADRKECLEAGMSDFLSKPAREADLVAMLRRWGSPHTRVA